MSVSRGPKTRGQSSDRLSGRSRRQLGKDVTASAKGKGVAFYDLDGTLADTAPDLAAAVNKMRHERGLSMVPLDDLRPLASAGARGLIGGAFGIGPDDHEFASMREEFLAIAKAEPDRCIVIDANQPPERIADQVWKIVRDRFHI